jgi:hypothetical protein
MLSDNVLWMFVVCSGIAVGAGLYELRVNVPDGSRPIEVRRGPSMLTPSQRMTRNDGFGLRCNGTADAAHGRELRDRMESCDCTRAMVARWRRRDARGACRHAGLLHPHVIETAATWPLVSEESRRRRPSLDTTQPHPIRIRVRWMARRATSSFAIAEQPKGARNDPTAVRQLQLRSFSII